jgi:predicted  nucleic acid-binding Zn-ribbon protein
MKEEKVITLPEFKMVVESIRSDIKKMSEGLNHRLDKMDARQDKTDGSLSAIKEHTGVLTIEIHEIKEELRSLKKQGSLLHEGQTEIKNDSKTKIERGEFAKLEKRVAKLENKVA